MSAVFESYNGINTVAYASNVLSYLSSIKDAGFIFSLLYFSFINSALFIDSNKPVLYIHSFIRSLDYKSNSPHCNSIGVLSTATRHDSGPEASCPGTPLLLSDVNQVTRPLRQKDHMYETCLYERGPRVTHVNTLSIITLQNIVPDVRNDHAHQFCAS